MLISPSAQLMQDCLSALEYVPAGQSDQLPADDPLIFPESHKIQLADPAVE
jgi:hypothetical protein